MAVYATLQDLIDSFGEDMLIKLTDRARPARNEIDQAVTDRALTAADDLINGFVRGRYSLPFAETPPLLKTLALDIAYYRLHTHKAPERVERAYQDAMNQLRDISKGILALPEPDGDEPAAAGGTVRIDAAPRVFDADSMEGF
ncbi:MAG: gp436 family protein [Magnetospiraceae bacterium]